MCGISALYRFTKVTESDIANLLEMNREMHYRGPDDSGTWSDDTCGLAQTRLSIIGLTNGRQPLFNEDMSLALVCNGEIYNYFELKKTLSQKGHVFNSDTDSETILHLYEEYGASCLEYLRGMFAFCLWDAKNKKLFVARDRVGEKTLYYARLQTGIVFSSELKAIRKHFLDNVQLDPKPLAETIRYNYPMDPFNTYIREIKRLMPGEYAVTDQRGVEFHRYWHRDSSQGFDGTYDEAVKRTRELMRESVDLCLRSDVPVAVLLSGGIDSSAIAAFAKETGRDVHAITAGYKGHHSCDERQTAKKFARERGLIWHEVELDESDFSSIFWEYSQYLDEPVADIASMSQWALYRKAREMGFPVLLGGVGGDELFYGYPYWNNYAESLALHKTHQSLFPWKGADRKITFLKFLFKNWKYILYAGYPYKINDRAIVDWTYDSYINFISDARIDDGPDSFLFRNLDVHTSLEETNCEVEAVYRLTFNTFMTTLCLYLADRLGMGNSVEIRSPLLDYKLVEHVSSLPFAMKYRKNHPKFFLKEVLRNVLPDYILNGEKKGFTPPLTFIKPIVDSYEYRNFKSANKFFNSIVADRILELVCFKHDK